MTQHTLAFLGFDRQEQDSIGAILDLADSALSCAWLITEDLESDVVMINLDAEDGQNIFSLQQQNRPNYRIILVAQDHGSEIDNCWFLTKKRHAPPSLKELAKLLNDVAVVLAEESQQNSANPSLPEIEVNAEIEPMEQEDTTEDDIVMPTASAADEPPLPEEDEKEEISIAPVPQAKPKMTRPLHPKNYFFGNLLQAGKDNACRVITLRQLPSLYLSPTDNFYYFKGSAGELSDYIFALPQYLKEAVVTKQKLQTLLKKEELSHSQPLDALIVHAILEVSQGRLLEGHSAEQTIKLTARPNLDKFPMLAPYSQIAEFAFQHPSSLFQCAEELKTPLSLLYDFYNACHLLGYIATETPVAKKTAPSATEADTPSKLGGFLKELLNKKIF